MYLFPSILWLGLPLIAVPVLIHLINLLRHRKVKWAAMDFLLQSQKKHKKWIIFKQLLLLLMRMAAIAAIAFMLAQPFLKNEWGDLLGGTQTHHVIVLDDSFSMSDRRGESSAFERARRVAQRLAEQAGAQGGRQSFSLLRFSHSARLALGADVDMVQERIDGDFSVKLERMLGEMRPSQTAAGPAAALEAVGRLPAKEEDENRILYVVSDFRAREWNEPTELRKALQQLTAENTKVHLVQCVDQLRPNLAITALAPDPGIRAAGVELFMELAVQNFGETPASQVAVRLEEDGQSRAGLVIDEIAPGEVVTRRFRVRFADPGPHTIAAHLRSDAVAADNSRFAVVDFPEAVPLLLVDGGPQQRDAYFLASSLAPGGSVQTGLRPQVVTPEFLRRHVELPRFHSIYLLNVGHLDEPEIGALEEYVAAGGGLCWFVGEESRAGFYNTHLYREGEGLFPVPLRLPTDLLVDRTDDAPDVEVERHPIFELFLGRRNRALDDVRIERYFSLPDAWQPDPDSGVQVLARLRNGAPLVVEKPLGEGRVVAFLTKASPEVTDLGSWNNWARNFSFIPTTLSLQGYLAGGRNRVELQQVGQRLVLELDPNEYESQVSFTLPATEDDLPLTTAVDAVTTPRGLTAQLEDTSTSGLYTATVRTRSGLPEERLFAYNVAAEEGDLHLLDAEALAQRLEGLTYRFHRAEELEFNRQEMAGLNLSQTILYGLLVLLVLEQLVAYWASYHPPARKVARR